MWVRRKRDSGTADCFSATARSVLPLAHGEGSCSDRSLVQGIGTLTLHLSHLTIAMGHGRSLTEFHNGSQYEPRHSTALRRRLSLDQATWFPPSAWCQWGEAEGYPADWNQSAQSTHPVRGFEILISSSGKSKSEPSSADDIKGRVGCADRTHLLPRFQACLI